MVEYKQSGWAFSRVKFPGTHLLLEDFRSRSWAAGGGGGSPGFEKQHTGLLNLTDDSDLHSSGIFQAGCRRIRGWKVRTAHVTQLHFRVSQRSAAGINTTTRSFSSHGPDEKKQTNPKPKLCGVTLRKLLGAKIKKNKIRRFYHLFGNQHLSSVSRQFFPSPPSVSVPLKGKKR